MYPGSAEGAYQREEPDTQQSYAIEVMISVALLVFGFWEIVRYIQMPAFIRTSAGLASGILNVLLVSVADVSVVITIYLFFGGINLLITCINAKDLKAE